MTDQLRIASRQNYDAVKHATWGGSNPTLCGRAVLHNWTTEEWDNDYIDCGSCNRILGTMHPHVQEHGRPAPSAATLTAPPRCEATHHDGRVRCDKALGHSGGHSCEEGPDGRRDRWVGTEVGAHAGPVEQPEPDREPFQVWVHVEGPDCEDVTEPDCAGAFETQAAAVEHAANVTDHDQAEVEAMRTLVGLISRLDTQAEFLANRSVYDGEASPRAERARTDFEEDAAEALDGLIADARGIVDANDGRA